MQPCHAFSFPFFLSSPIHPLPLLACVVQLRYLGGCAKLNPAWDWSVGDYYTAKSFWYVTNSQRKKISSGECGPRCLGGGAATVACIGPAVVPVLCAYGPPPQH